MVVSRVEKQEKLASIKNHMESFDATICISYENLISSELERLRDICFEKGDKVVFGKNTLISRACNDEVANDVDENLKRSNVLIFSNDIFGSLRMIKDYVKSLKNYKKIKLSISCAVLEGKFANLDLVKKFEDIPSKDSIYIELVNILNSPLKNLVKILNNPMLDLCKILDYKSKNC